MIFEEYWKETIVPEWGESEPIKEITEQTWNAATQDKVLKCMLWFFAFILGLCVGTFILKSMRKENTIPQTVQTVEESLLSSYEPIKTEYLTVGKHKIIGRKGSGYHGLPLENDEKVKAVVKLLLLSGIVEENFEECFGINDGFNKERWSYYTYNLREDLVEEEGID